MGHVSTLSNREHQKRGRLVRDASLKHFFAVLALIAGLVAQGSMALAEDRSFDGTWSVQLVTGAGVCESSYHYAVAIRDGQVQLASGGAGPAITGRVKPNGTVGLQIQHAAANGAVSGRLRAHSGFGTWTVSSVCSGRWPLPGHCPGTLTCFWER